MFLTFIIIIAAILGSFANMLIYRLPLNTDIVIRRSHCPTCKHNLGILDLIPVISYLWMKGKCRYCSTPIPIRYILVEVITIILFVVMWLKFGYSTDFLYFSFLSFILLVIAFIDYRTYIIPDKLVIVCLLIGLSRLISTENYSNHGLGALLGFGFLILGLVSFWIYKKPALGGGDIKLFAAIGLCLGLEMTGMAIYLSVLFGGLIGIILILTKIKSRKDNVPFGPFIFLGTICAISGYDYLIQLIRTCIL